MKKLLFAILLTGVLAPGYAQMTESERNLESAVRLYNQMRERTETLKPETLTDADLASVNKSVDAGVALLDPLIRKETGKMADVARYFRTNFQYEKAFILGMKGRQDEAFDIFRSLDADMNSYTAARFPLEYAFEGRNFIIKWENFAPTQAEYNLSMTELSYGKKDYVNALAYANKAAAQHAFLSDFHNALNNYFIVKIKTERREYDRTALDAAVNGLEAYGEIEPEKRAGIEALTALPDLATALLEQTLTARPELADNGRPYARAAAVMRAEGRSESYRSLAAKALRAGHRDRTFLDEALAEALAAKDRPLGLLAADQLAAITGPDDCAAQRALSGNYERLGESAKARTWRDKAAACERKQRTAEVRARRDFGLYLGGYVLPLFQGDWGGVVGIVTRKVYVEGSYQRREERRDKLWDLRLKDIDGAGNTEIRWDGYYTHLGIHAFSGRRGLKTYGGVLLGYNLREYEPQRADVFDRATNSYLGAQEFNPVEKRYILMFNGGLHSYGRVLAANVFCGAGFSYNTFERGNASFDDPDKFLYENVLLENRKADRVSFMVRIGLTLGFQFGTNTGR